eukprot:scaffold126473_cov32-Tisochrysis_lutea.AAC.1
MVEVAVLGGGRRAHHVLYYLDPLLCRLAHPTRLGRRNGWSRGRGGLIRVVGHLVPLFLPQPSLRPKARYVHCSLRDTLARLALCAERVITGGVRHLKLAHLRFEQLPPRELYAPGSALCRAAALGGRADGASAVSGLGRLGALGRRAYRLGEELRLIERLHRSREPPA